MRKKPLPQFSSYNEAVEFYSKYGKLTYFGRVGHACNESLYSLDAIDGRKLTLVFGRDGSVREIPK